MLVLSRTVSPGCCWLPHHPCLIICLCSGSKSGSPLKNIIKVPELVCFLSASRQYLPSHWWAFYITSFQKCSWNSLEIDRVLFHLFVFIDQDGNCHFFGLHPRKKKKKEVKSKSGAGLEPPWCQGQNRTVFLCVGNAVVKIHFLQSGHAHI